MICRLNLSADLRRFFYLWPFNIVFIASDTKRMRKKPIWRLCERMVFATLRMTLNGNNVWFGAHHTSTGMGTNIDGIRKIFPFSCKRTAERKTKLSQISRKGHRIWTHATHKRRIPFKKTDRRTFCKRQIWRFGMLLRSQAQMKLNMVKIAHVIMIICLAQPQAQGYTHAVLHGHERK